MGASPLARGIELTSHGKHGFIKLPTHEYAEHERCLLGFRATVKIGTVRDRTLIYQSTLIDLTG